MHARNRTWPLGSDPAERCRQRTLPVQGGDGSTLSLDFTTGVLDPRITFTRDSNATFINSSGLMQYADANMFRNSQFSSSGGTPTSWTASVTGSGTVTSASGEVTCTVTTAGRAFIYEATTPPGASGLTYSLSVDLVVVSGSPKYSDILLATAGSTVLGWYLDGVALSGANPTAQGNNNAQTGRVTLVFTTAASSNLRFGPGSQGLDMTNVTVKFSRPSLIPGNIASPTYYESRSTTAGYYAPRFDYDPTSIGTPRGLLIEGSATNLLNYSEDFTNAIWSLDNSGATNPVVTANYAAAPDGNTTADRLQLNKTGGAFSRIQSLFATTGTAGAAYTASVWMRTTSGTGTANVGLRVGAETVGGNYQVTGTWKRFERSVNVPSTDIKFQIMLWDNIVGNDETADILVWGAQLELGSGASSYIPTGSSTVQRAADVAYIDGANFSSWYNASTQTGTLFADITHSAQSGPNSGIELGAGLGGQVSSNRISLRRDVVIVDGVGSLAVAPNGASQQFKTAIAFAPGTGNTAACRNGGTVSNPAQSLTGVSGINALKLYVDSTLYPYGWIKQVKVWPTNLPNATLQSITTL